MSSDANADADRPPHGQDPTLYDVPVAVTDPDEPLLLVIGDPAGGAVDAALGLADARATSGRPTILADASIDEPVLHRRLGVENLEGLADLFLFGASMSRVLARPAGRDFDFIPTGAYVADPAGVFDSARWDRIADELRAKGSLLMLFAPPGSDIAATLSRRVHRAVLVGTESNATRLAAGLDDRCLVLGFVDPVPLGADPGPLPPLTDTQREQLSEPPVTPPGPRRRPVPAGILGAALIAALLIMAAGWFLYRGYMAQDDQPTVVQPGAAPEPEPVARGEPVETPIPISVAVEAHQDLTSARERVAALRRAEPSIEFYLAPVAVSGAVYYRLLAGPVADRDSGTALLQRLVDAGHKTAFDTWAVRPTEYAFLLGEHDTEEEARRQVDSLAGNEVPAYVVQVRHSPGQPRYRVYGGAFETVMEAEVMAEILRASDVEGQLVPRTGEPIR